LGLDKSKETFWKPSQAEILIDQELFVFNVKPFYLRLRFQQKLTDQEENVKSQFDIETGIYTIKIPKLVPGEEFVDLDLLSKLLQPKRTAPKSKIEVLDSENLEDSDEDEEEEAIQNWEIEQSVVNEEKDLVQSRIPWVHHV